MPILWKWRMSVFLHWLIVGRSWNWPDLRSLISEIRTIKVIGFIIQFWKFENIWSKPVTVVRVQTCLGFCFAVPILYVEYFVCRSGHVTRPGDLTWHDLGKLFYAMLEIDVQICRHANLNQATRRRFLVFCEKPDWGSGKQPPAVLGLNISDDFLFCRWPTTPGSIYQVGKWQRRIMCSIVHLCRGRR